MKNKLKIALIIVILTISSFTHLYRINHTYIFNNDEARDVLIIKKMVDTGKPVLLGPQTSIGNMYLGPIYYYLMTPSLLISRMDPVGPAIMVGLFGIATSYLLFFYGSKKYGLLGGTIASLLYSLSPVMLHYSRSSWNPNIIPFFAISLIISADYKHKKLSWLLFGLCAGVLFQLHYVALALVFIIGIYKLKQSHQIQDVLTAILGFFIVSSPFWLFEFRHNFVNSQALFTFLREGSQNADLNTSYLSRLLGNLRLLITGVWGSASIALTQLPNYLIIISALLLFGVLPFLSQGLYLWYLSIGSIVIVSILKEPLNVHYISFLFPIIALAFARLSTTNLKTIRLISTFTLLYVVLHCIPTLRYNLLELNSSQSIRAKETASYIVAQSDGKPYNVVSTPGTYATTVEYFLSLTSNPPKNSFENLIFDICEGKQCPLSDTTTTVFYGSGATHPSISEYLGHPAVNEFKTIRTIIKNEPVSYGTWVATMTIDH